MLNCPGEKMTSTIPQRPHTLDFTTEATVPLPQTLEGSASSSHLEPSVGNITVRN